MTPARLLSTSAFRYALIYAALVWVALAGVLGVVYVRTVAVIDAQIEDTIEAEIRGLAEQYRQRGLGGLRTVIERRSADNPGLRNVYLLTDPAYRPIAGNLESWPAEAVLARDWVAFSVRPEMPEAGPRPVKARPFDLTGGVHLLVGRDTTEREVLRRAVLGSAAVAGVLGGALALAIGLAMSRQILRRIDGLGRGAGEILAGDLNRRMPVSPRDDEFDRLAERLNAMLDRIQALMDGMRSVADDIAHDLKSPISRLRSRVELRLMQPRDAEADARVLEETIAEADAILATFNALLSIALAESGALRRDFETVDPAAVARDAEELYAPAAAEAGLAFEADIAETGTILGSRELLSRALANLLDNALKYTPDGGRVRLSVRPGPDGPRLAVADTGPGIPAADRERVLDRFTRLEESRGRPGSGLGLALVAAVARLHDARLALDDTPGGGLTATIAFAGPERAPGGRAAQGLRSRDREALPPPGAGVG
ncbi:MAG: HAMP domain-containing sensor histidine kinase [Azospirillaceae bacterium]